MHIWQRYIETRDEDKWREYCKARNKVKKLTRQARKNIEKDIAKQAKKIQSSFGNSKTKTKQGICQLHMPESNALTENDNDKAETLLKHFSSVFTHEPIV